MGKTGWFIVTLVAVAIIGLWIWNFLFFAKCEDSNLAGDACGVVNSLFSGLAFLAVCVTLILQQKDLSSQRHLMVIQTFESSFFTLLNFYEQKTRDLSFGMVEGRASMKHYLSYLYASVGKSDANNFDGEMVKKAIEINNHHTIQDFWEYYRTIRSILLYVDSYGFPGDENTQIMKKQQYLRILKSQMSTYELDWLLFLSLSDKEQYLKRLVEKYSLLAELKDVYIDEEKNSFGFDKMAFGG